MKMTLTPALLKALPPVPEGKRRYRITDTEIPGFMLEIWPSGSGTYWLRYADQQGRNREIKIARMQDVTLAQARKKAQVLRAEIALDGDPAARRDQRRAVPTFRDFVVERYLPYVKERLKSYRDQESFCRLRLLPWWGTKVMTEIRPVDVVDLQARLRGEGLSDATVNRYTALVRRIFNLALRWQVYSGINPAQHADMLREHGRERFLTGPELRRLFQALDEEPNQTAAACIALLALTGARKGEALAMRWEDVDLPRRTWRVPRSKSGRMRHIPLSDSAAALLARQPRLPNVPWVFPGALYQRYEKLTLARIGGIPFSALL
jgi:integrase